MTAKEMIKKYSLFLSMDGTMVGTNYISAVKRDGMFEFLKAAKPEIIAILKSEKEAEEKAANERKAKIAAIEGLKEIKAARESVEEYHRRFNLAMERGDGHLPKKPDVNMSELTSKYPRANAYLTAESWAIATNYDKSAAGRKALERIINGEDYETALAEMNREWSEYCNEHIWD